MCTIGMISKINRCSCIVIYNRSGSVGCLHNRPVGIVHNEFFSKSINKMFEPATYLDPVWPEAGKLYGISEQVTPETSVCADHQCVILVQFNILQPDRL